MEIGDELKEKLVSKLAQVAERHAELGAMLADPDVVNDHQRLAAVAREHGRLAALSEKYDQVRDARRRYADAESMLREEADDEEMAELARDELEEAEELEQRLLEEAADLLAAADEERERNVLVEIRAGTGGEEAALFARDLLGMYQRYAERQGWKTELMDSSSTDLGGLREVTLSVAGRGVWKKLRHESGGHRVQRVPQTESQGRIHTSLATVAVLPQVEEVEVDIDPNDLDISYMRSSGPGGQHVNKTSSCVRIVHKPTGITVRCQDEKSQQVNRKKAMKILLARLYEKQEQEQHEKRDAMRKSQVGTGDRNERIRTYNFPQDRITDHRAGIDVFGIESFLMGDCDRLLEPLADYFRKQKIRQLIEEPLTG